MKTKEELNALKEEIRELNEKLANLSEEELTQVTGGGIQYNWREHGQGGGGGGTGGGNDAPMSN